MLLLPCIVHWEVDGNNYIGLYFLFLFQAISGNFPEVAFFNSI